MPPLTPFEEARAQQAVADYKRTGQLAKGFSPRIDHRILVILTADTLQLPEEHVEHDLELRAERDALVQLIGALAGWTAAETERKVRQLLTRLSEVSR